jgi:hypothetical protein
LHGLAAGGGAHGNGTFFRSTRLGLTQLHSFELRRDEQLQYLVQATDAHFYGTIITRDPAARWTFYRLDATGTFAALSSEVGSRTPTSLIQGRDEASTVRRFPSTGVPSGLFSAGRGRDAHEPT